MVTENFTLHPSPFTFPKAARFGKDLPKSKIYQHANPPASVRKAFVNEVERITWSYKLAPKTVNLPARGFVQEIEVFTITLRGESLSPNVLAAIDKAIPSPIFFVLTYQDKIRYVAAYKRKNEADKSRQVVSGYFESDWLPEGGDGIPLPVSLDMDGLYHQLLLGLIPLDRRDGESMEQLVLRVDLVRKLERDLEKLETKRHKATQFNRKVELNSACKALQQELERARCSTAQQATQTG